MIKFMEDNLVPMKFRRLLIDRKPWKPSHVFKKNTKPFSIVDSPTPFTYSPERTLPKHYLQKIYRIVHSILYNPKQTWSSTWHIDQIQVNQKGHVLVTWAPSTNPGLHLTLDNEYPTEELKLIGQHLKAALKSQLKLPLHLVPKVNFQYKDLQLEFLMDVVEKELQSSKDDLSTSSTNEESSSPTPFDSNDLVARKDSIPSTFDSNTKDELLKE